MDFYHPIRFRMPQEELLAPVPGLYFPAPAGAAEFSPG